MLPAVRPGDVLVVHRRDLREVQPGDIAFFSSRGGVVAHRVKFTNAHCLTTQGDSLPQPDPAITMQNFLGVVVSIERDRHFFVPSRRRGMLSRFTAAILRRSDFAMRMWLAAWIRIRALRKSRIKDRLDAVPANPVPSS